MADSSAPSRAPGRLLRCAPLALLALAGVLFVAFGGRRYLTFAALAEHRHTLVSLVEQGGAVAILGFVAGYAGLTALSVPGAMLLTLASGFLFGPWLGSLCALIGATVGASVVFLAARTGLSGLAARAGPLAQRLEAGFRSDAFNYLLVLRLVPIFPFWLVNLVAGLAGVRLATYIGATFCGMISGAFVYASLGNGVGAMIEAGQHPNPHMIFQPDILLPIVGLAVLALLPVFYKRWRVRHPHELAE